MHQKTLSLYVHIPFCVKKCAYCDFLSMPADKSVRDKYVQMLLKEIENEAVFYHDYVVETVFFGGGTPTILEAKQLVEILESLRTHFSFVQDKEPGRVAEITTECNPGTVDAEDLQLLHQGGFNRLSIGLQSADNEELRRLGRIHTWETFVECFHHARAAGFRNVNIDLMSALPGQSLASYRRTLEKVLELEPEHISAYSLIIEEGTPFYELYGNKTVHAQWDLPDEEVERGMYDLTDTLLSKHNYCRYEISNYAKPGMECGHNQVYWKRGNYLGLGLGASSMVENVRFHRTEFLKQYLDALKKDDFSVLCMEKEVLDKTAQMEEFMFLGLRRMKGVSEKKFCRQFGITMQDIYGSVLEKLQKQGLIKREKDRVMLTKRGIDVSNIVFSEFLL